MHPVDISASVYSPRYTFTIVLFCVVVVVVVVLRIYTRLAIKHSFGADNARMKTP